MTGVADGAFAGAFVWLFVLLLVFGRTGTTSSSESLNVKSTYWKGKWDFFFIFRSSLNIRENSFSFTKLFTESPVVVEDGSFGFATVLPLFPPFTDCVLILDFGESSAIITSIDLHRKMKGKCDFLTWQFKKKKSKSENKGKIFVKLWL